LKPTLRRNTRDDLIEMFLKRMASIQVKAKEELQRVREEQQQTTEHLLAVLTDLVEIAEEDRDQDDATVGKHLREVLVKQGGHAELLQKCQTVAASAGDHSQPLMWQFYTSHRKALFQLVRSLPIHAATQDQSLIDALIGNTSTIHPKVIHSDTQGQSTNIFALSYLLGIERMPRIRHWKDLKFYRPSKQSVYQHIDTLFKETIDWDLLEKHWTDLMQVALSIRAGKLQPSILLRKLGHESQKNRLYQAFRE